MSATAQQGQYFASQVLTATPHRLHLLLIEGALRQGRRAEQAIGDQDHANANDSLMRMIDIVGEMLAGVRGNQSPLNQQLASLYLYLFRRVSEAKLNGDLAILAETLQLLEYERETWQQACANFASETAAATDGARSTAREPTAPRPLAPPVGDATTSHSQSSVSFEA